MSTAVIIVPGMASGRRTNFLRCIFMLSSTIERCEVVVHFVLFSGEREGGNGGGSRGKQKDHLHEVNIAIA